MASKDNEMTVRTERERNELRDLLESLDRPCDQAVIRSGYSRLSASLQAQAASNGS
ncbi:hypothetical protein KCG44_02110 [Pacificimonas sp. WHA3]|uniref:Uncharacterized protein n=1 Tax=Pacificimonas pallii TaxID=2827236 RepID=A0ABS6SB43_9SPHN|nr:hypothetical protein [Pacificimonas pallii]MBV7255574.1 hypothetical protein [Pacificimonas pallii]